MKVALPITEHRISPVFDVAKRLLIVEIEKHQVRNRSVWELEPVDIYHRVKKLKDFEIDVLICGAISMALENIIRENRITVIPHICGCFEEVLQSYCSKHVIPNKFLMPGCQRSRKRSGKRSGKHARGYSIKSNVYI